MFGLPMTVFRTGNARNRSDIPHIPPGRSSRTLAIAPATRSIAFPISSAVVNLPIPNRIEEPASSSERPIAFRTWLGAGEEEVQAEPVETATSRSSAISSAESIP